MAFVISKTLEDEPNKASDIEAGGDSASLCVAVPAAGCDADCAADRAFGACQRATVLDSCCGVLLDDADDDDEEEGSCVSGEDEDDESICGDEGVYSGITVGRVGEEGWTGLRRPVSRSSFSVVRSGGGCKPQDHVRQPSRIRSYLPLSRQTKR